MKVKRLVVVLLAFLMSFGISTISGCKTKEPATTAPTESKPDVDSYKEMRAAPVAYRSDGSYTCELECFSKDISKDDIKVEYLYFDKEGYDSHRNSNINDYYIMKEASVESASLENNRLSVDFKDSDALKNKTDSYAVVIEDDKLAGGVEVMFNDYTLSVSPEYIKATDEVIRLVIHNDNGEFIDNINKDLIRLQAGFEGFDIEGLSNNKKDLTIQLVGSLKYHDYASIYPNGEVVVSKDAILNCNEDITVSVEVKGDIVSLDASGLRYNNNTLTLPIVSADINNISNLTVDDIKFSKDVNLLDVINDDDSAYLVIDTNGMSKAEAIEYLDGSIVNVDSRDVDLDFTEGSFYPVIDFIELKGDRFHAIISLYAENGMFNRSITKEMIKFRDNINGIVINSIELEGDSLLNMDVTMDSDGMSLENYWFNIDVLMKKGAMITDWGDDASEFSCCRSFSYADTGRFDIIAALSSSLFGNMVGIASLVVSIVSLTEARDTASELKTIIENNHADVLKHLNHIETELSKIQGTQNLLAYKNYHAKIMTLSDYSKRINEILVDGMNEYAKADPLNGVHPAAFDITQDKPDEKLKKEWEGYMNRFYTDNRGNGYLNHLINKGDYNKFKNLPQYFFQLEEQLVSCYNGLDDAIEALENSYPYTYNSNKEWAQPKKEALAEIKAALKIAHEDYLFYYGYYRTIEENNTERPEDSCKLEIERFDAKMKLIDEKIAVCDELINYKMEGFYDSNNLIYIYTLNMDLKNHTIETVNTGAEKYPFIYNLTEAQINEIIRRSGNVTLGEAFTKIGIPIYDKTYGLAVTLTSKDKGGLSYGYHWYNFKFTIMDWNGNSLARGVNLKSFKHKEDNWYSDYDYIFFRQDVK